MAVIPWLASLATGQTAPVPLVEATIADLRLLMQSGLLTSEGLVQRYLLRIAAYDQVGPTLKSMIGTNPAVLAEARQRDAAMRQGARGPLFGIPVLLKDNIDALPMATSAGSVALARSVPPDDSFLASRLRQAGAVVIGKASMTEFANFMTTFMPSGYSSLGGAGVSPYDPRRDASGAALSQPGGSSSGSGIASSANLTAAAIGTETSGSILSPGTNNSVVGIKPTVGLVSRDGILPITADQDIAGPMARTVADAATVLGVISGYDPNDPVTAACLVPGNRYEDYRQFLDRSALNGARIAVPRSPFYNGLNAEQLRIMNEAVATLRSQGADLIDPYPFPSVATPPICISHPPPANESTVLIFGMKRDLSRYLSSLGPNAPMRSLAQIIAYNLANASVALRYGQVILLATDLYDPTPNGPDEQRYRSDRQRDLLASRGALDSVYAGPDLVRNTEDDIDAILFPATRGSDLPARAGYPSIVVPGGFIARTGLPSLPFGVTFSGPAFSEPALIAFSYAFEQATKHRLPPSSAPALPSDRIPLNQPRVTELGSGCAGSNGVPVIAAKGPPVIASSAFAIALGSLRQNAPAFVGISAQPGSGSIGSCQLFAAFPFHVLFTGTSTANGDFEVGLPIPWDPSLSGGTLWVQGGALDPLGGALGIAALTGGLAITIGG
jgi:amidase